jgi:hypothetical protein
MKKVLIFAAVVLLAVGGLLFWGSYYATSVVKEQLSAQKITFPDKATLEVDNKSLVKYAGATVDTGKEAKAYSEYINGHLKKVANGQTYSEVSSAFQKDKNNQTLAGQRTTLFMGETLRGLLLSAWGWGLMGMIAMYAGIGLWATALIALVGVAMLGGNPIKKTASKKSASKKKK